MKSFEVSRRDEAGRSKEAKIRWKQELNILQKTNALAFYTLVIGEYKLFFHFLTANGKEGNKTRNFIPYKIEITQFFQKSTTIYDAESKQ